MTDIDLWVVNALRAALPGDVKVGVVDPSGASRFVQVRYDGGTELDVLRERGRLTLNVYADRLDTVKALADLVRTALDTAVQNTGVIMKCVKGFGWNRVAESDQALSHLVAGFDLIVRRA
jgi:hypothetical protein